MPKNFLHFALEPFNLYHELVTTETECFICLNDSKVIETELNDDLKELFNDSFDQFHLIMNLNIKQTRIYFVLHMDDSPVPYFFKVPPVYLDELGNVQIGFGFYGFEIFLSDERLEKLADDFISGEIMKYAAFDDE